MAWISILIAQSTLILVLFSFKPFGEDCSVGFLEDITVESNITEFEMELDVIPEDAEIIIPSLTMTCNGYISHVSIGYEGKNQTSVSNNSVYLQLWRISHTAALEGSVENYTLVEEVLLPIGDPWPHTDNQRILNDYKLPKRITVQSSDVIGFRTPYNSSVNVLVNTTDQREVLSNSDDILSMIGVPLLLITHRKTCNKNLPNNIVNVSDSAKEFPIESVSGNTQILFPSVNFTCGGIINQIVAWYQVLAAADDLHTSSIIQVSIKFQIWHPISDSRYELVSEATILSAMDDQPVMVDNLNLQFYSGSVVGIYIETSRRSGTGRGAFRLLSYSDVPQSFLLVTNDKPCIIDITSTGVLTFADIDIEAALDYVVNEEETDQTFYCRDDQITGKNKTNLTVVTTSAVIAIIVTVILLILVIACCWRRYKTYGRTKSHNNFQPTLMENTRNTNLCSGTRYHRFESVAEPLLSLATLSVSGSYEIINERATDSFKTSNFQQIHSELTEVEINPDEIEIGNEIGSGNFGVVYHGVWNHNGIVNQVAIKTLYDEASKEEKTKLLREAATVQRFLHTNIVKFYGVITSRGRIMVVLEYLPNGSLIDFLRSAKPKENEPVNQLLHHLLLNFAREIGYGMNYLSNKSFIHRDLAARNILLTEENVCKISDFGLSRDLDKDDYYITHGGTIPVKWTAPEALLFRTYTTSSDVWSYAVVLYEMWSLGERPYRDYDNSEVSSLIGTGYRLPPPPGCARHIYNLMIQCWNPVHRLRPSFAAILKTISQPPYVLFHWFDEDKEAAGPQCDVLGAPLGCGHNLFLDLQNAYK